MSDERKVYDTDDTFISHNVRLAKDAQVFGGDATKPPLVRLTFTCESRMANNNPKIKTGWVDAKVRDFDATQASFLKKGDVLSIEGKPYLEEYPEGSGKLSLKLDQAKTHIPLDLFMKLKERGFTPGAKGAGGAKGAKPAGKKTARPVQDVDFGDEE